MVLLWVSFILFLMYTVGLTAGTLLNYDKIVHAVLSGRIGRVQLYAGQMIGMWTPSLLLLIPVASGAFSLKDLGVCRIAPNESAWLAAVCSAVYILYMGYLFRSHWKMRRNLARGGRNDQNVTDRMKALCPATGREKRVWIVTAVSVGITEEFLFRGFVLYALGTLFPALPMFAALIAAALIFGFGHLYQGVAKAVVPTLLGLLYCVFFIAFGSLIPCILVHILQDLGAAYVLREEPERPKEKNKAE